jgi:hypothetical protein
MSKVLKDAKSWLKEADKGACFCEMGESASGQPYHTLECVQTSEHIIKKLVEALELAEQNAAQQSVHPTLLTPSEKIIKCPQCHHLFTIYIAPPQSG